MRQLDNLFGPHIKKFKKKFNDLPSIEISFSNVGDGENGESIYRVSISYLDNYVSDLMSNDDEWERIGKMFNKLIEDTNESLRRLAEHRSRIGTTEIEMPHFARSSHRVGYVDIRNFTPVMASEPVDIRQRDWNGGIRNTGVTVESAFRDFCNELEEV